MLVTGLLTQRRLQMGGDYLLGLRSTLRRARLAVRQKMMMLAPFR